MQNQRTVEFAEYRAMYAQLPQGDPLAGPAYGTYDKSKGLGMVIGIVASIVTMGAAMPMLASGVLATQIAGGAMMAGGILSGVGTLTGNKKLMKIGGVLSLAGGVGGFLSGLESVQGLGGAFGPGSGSQAIAEMSSNFMQSVNDTVGAQLFSKASISGGGGLIDRATAGESAISSPVQDVGAGIEQIGGGTNAGTVDIAGNSGSATPLTPEEAARMAADNNEAGVLFGKGEVAPATGAPQTGAAAGPAGTQPPAPVADAKPVLNKQPGFLSRVLGDVTEGQGQIIRGGMEALKGFATAGMGPDQQKQIDAISELYGARTATETQQLVNSGKQVAVLDPNDPDLENKKAQAAAAGHTVILAPQIGTGGVKVGTGLASQAAFGNVPQQPVRQPTFNSPSPQQPLRA